MEGQRWKASHPRQIRPRNPPAHPPPILTLLTDPAGFSLEIIGVTTTRTAHARSAVRAMMTGFTAVGQGSGKGMTGRARRVRKEEVERYEGDHSRQAVRRWRRRERSDRLVAQQTAQHRIQPSERRFPRLGGESPRSTRAAAGGDAAIADQDVDCGPVGVRGDASPRQKPGFGLFLQVPRPCRRRA